MIWRLLLITVNSQSLPHDEEAIHETQFSINCCFNI